MSKFTYRNATTTDLIIVGFGLIKAGATVESKVELHHPALVPPKSTPVQSEGGSKSKAKQEPSK